MIVKIDRTGPAQTRWYEYAIRFVFGGLVTALAGAIGKKWGPAVGGLFLAFPAILPASATLLEKHQRERKQRRGMAGAKRGIDAAGADAAGAAIGSIGLLAFAAICWRLLPRYPAGVVLAGATLAWALIGGTLWILRKRHFYCRPRV